MVYSYSASDFLSNETKHASPTLIFTHRLLLRVKAPLTGTGTAGSILRSSILSFRELRKRPEMVTIKVLAFLLPAKQGKHLPGPYYMVPLLRAKPLWERESKPRGSYIYPPGPF